MLSKYAFILICFTIFFLIFVIISSNKVNGSARWINLLGFVNFQPSELAKLAFIIYISAWFTKREKLKNEITNFKDNITKFFIPYLLITGFIAALVVLEKDLGTTIIIIAISLLMLILGDDTKYMKFNVILSASIFFIGGLIAIVIEPYRMQRLLTYLNTSQSSKFIEGAGYQVHQILIAIGSGGIFGVGFTQSVQKNQYLVGTTPITDSIFAVIAEELGLIGALLLIMLYIYLVYLIFKVATKSKNSFGKFVAAGIGIWIGIQALLNILANLGTIPLTGIPLPLISYGGSSVIMLLIGIGLVLNINKDEKN
jgi:cell division protein FtsW